MAFTTGFTMTPAQVTSILAVSGILDTEVTARPEYIHHDGSVDVVERRAEMDQDEPIRPEDPLVVQVSRWDPLKDPVGVMQGFADQVVPVVPGARLLLAGPSPAGAKS